MLEQKDEIVELEKQPLLIFKTEEDRTGRDIAKLSDFFDDYLKEMSISLYANSEVEVLKEIPVADLGVVNDVMHHLQMVSNGKITLIPDFDSLSPEIKTKLKKGIYKIGESRQVEDNLRAVIVDENNTRVKDITLKRVVNNPGTIDTIRSIGNQMQMKQIYSKLAEIQELQTYQIEKERNRDFLAPFLDARHYIIQAEKCDMKQRVELLNKADDLIMKALHLVYVDLETTSKFFVKKTKLPFKVPGVHINEYMSFIAKDLEIATKFVGIRMRINDYIGKADESKYILEEFNQVMYDFVAKSVNKHGESVALLMHGHTKYDDSNRDAWYKFVEQIKPALEQQREMIMLENERELYYVTVED